MAHYLFNVAAVGPASRDQSTAFLRAKMWGVDADEPHGTALSAGDVALVYLSAPERKLIGRVEIASAVHEWTPDEARIYPGDSSRGVLLAHVEEWDPPVPMESVLSQMDPADKAKADFEMAVVRITGSEYETAVGVAAGRPPSRQPRGR